tara:strand:- start:113 stop:394 length:282 start_codon:yes stop_codon:yes gene_type:complete
MKITITSLLMALFLISCANTSQQITVNKEDEEKKKKKDQDIVCERIFVTGSRLPQKVCTTLAQREKLEEEKESSKKIIRDAQTKGGTIGNLPD